MYFRLINQIGLSVHTSNQIVLSDLYSSSVSVLYKVFVCGDKYHVAPRPSINLGKLQTQSNQLDVYNFHSDTVSKVSGVSTSQVQEVCHLHDNGEFSGWNQEGEISSINQEKHYAVVHLIGVVASIIYSILTSYC